MLPLNTLAAVVAILSLGISAAPSLQRRDNSCAAPLTASENANFDDIDGISGTSINPIPEPYKGLYYQGFTFADVLETNLLPGPVPHSGNGYAFASTVSTLLQGTAMMTTNYKNTNTSTFTLTSLYYAIILEIPAEAATALNMEGYLDITGYHGPDNSDNDAYEVCSQQLTYDPTTLLGVQQMAFADQLDSCFTDLTHVIFTYSFEGGAQLLNPLIGLLLDDVKYDIDYCED